MVAYRTFVTHLVSSCSDLDSVPVECRGFQHFAILQTSAGPTNADIIQSSHCVPSNQPFLQSTNDSKGDAKRKMANRPQN